MTVCSNAKIKLNLHSFTFCLKITGACNALKVRFSSCKIICDKPLHKINDEFYNYLYFIAFLNHNDYILHDKLFLVYIYHSICQGLRPLMNISHRYIKLGLKIIIETFHACLQ